MSPLQNSIGSSFVQRRRIRQLEFVFLSTIGIGIFLLTDSFAAGIALPAIRAGWRSLRTAVWILQRDLHSTRARVSSLFFVATAFWQIAAAAFGGLLILVLMEKLTGRGVEMDQFIVTMVRLSAGVVLTSVVGMVSSVSAAIARVRVWVNPKLPEMVDDDLLAVEGSPAKLYFNYATFVVATSLTFPFLVVAYYLLSEFQSGVVTLVVGTLGPFMVFVSYLWFANRILANNAAECWCDGA